MRFDFAIAHVPGKLMYTADSLSRSPQECKAQESKSWNDLHDEVEAYVNAVLVTLPASDQRLDEIRSELKNDDTLKTVMQYVQNGWPEEKRRVHGPLTKYWSERGNISLHSGLLLRGRRIIIPPRLRADLLRRLPKHVRTRPRRCGGLKSLKTSQRLFKTVPHVRKIADSALSQ